MPKPLAVIWASPWTLLGVAVGALGVATAGRVQRRCGVLEFHGGLVTTLLDALPYQPAAMTLGHVVLGRHASCLDQCRAHELVHVRQYERWGPFFIPAYFVSSLAQLVRGRRPYRDNFFEREAFEGSPSSGGHRVRVWIVR